MATIDLSQRLTLSVDEAMSALGIGKTLMYELLGNGSIDSFTVGRKRLIPASSVHEWMSAMQSYGIGQLEREK